MNKARAERHQRIRQLLNQGLPWPEVKQSIRAIIRAKILRVEMDKVVNEYNKLRALREEWSAKGFNTTEADLELARLSVEARLINERWDERVAKDQKRVA